MVLSLILAMQNSAAFDLAGQVAAKLEKLQAASYSYQRVLDYPGEKYHREMSAQLYVQFGKFEPIGARYQARTESWNIVFNGTLAFKQKDGDKPEVKVRGPKASDFSSESVLKNSVIGMASALRGMQKSATAHFALRGDDTIEIESPRMEISPSGVEPVEYTPIYLITIDPKSKLPIKIVQKLKNREDTITAVFSNWNLNPKAPKPESWEPKLR